MKINCDELDNLISKIVFSDRNILDMGQNEYAKHRKINRSACCMIETGKQKIKSDLLLKILIERNLINTEELENFTSKEYGRRKHERPKESYQ